MSAALKLEVSPETIIKAVKRMKSGERQRFLEDLMAATVAGIPSEYSRGSPRLQSPPAEIS